MLVIKTFHCVFQAAKNLMNAVVLTVKASYVASTKYRKLETKVLYQKKI